MTNVLFESVRERITRDRRMIITTKKAKRERSAPAGDAVHLAREAIARHNHFRGRADGFRLEQCGDVLTVRGQVPSFYLRQVLQTVLNRLDGVGVVDNQVDVISCDGLSSVRNTRALGR